MNHPGASLAPIAIKTERDKTRTNSKICSTGSINATFSIFFIRMTKIIKKLNNTQHMSINVNIGAIGVRIPDPGIRISIPLTVKEYKA